MAVEEQNNTTTPTMIRMKIPVKNASLIMEGVEGKSILSVTKLDKELLEVATIFYRVCALTR
jgi:hypothetical protein